MKKKLRENQKAQATRLGAGMVSGALTERRAWGGSLRKQQDRASQSEQSGEPANQRESKRATGGFSSIVSSTPYNSVTTWGVRITLSSNPLVTVVHYLGGITGYHIATRRIRLFFFVVRAPLYTFT